jgi:LysR family transcriptional regulator, regulator of peptidoglycan recycling
MRREEMADLTAFVVVAEERNFTRAAAKLGLSQSALSQIVRRLEERLGVRLLARTTRSVAPTEAGERLVQTLAPMLHDLDQSISDLSEFRDKPAGTIRITTVEHAAKTILCPALTKLLSEYPDITVEIIVDYGLADVVADRFDAGVRLGEQVAKDMIAVRIAPDIPMAIVGSPAYF